MESRKEQLQKQIIEALKAKDNDLYSLLKSQWAHRFGVESLEELRTLESTFENEDPINEDNQKNNQSQECFLESDKEIPIKYTDNKEQEITNDTKKLVEVEDKEPLEVKSNKIVDKENFENKIPNQIREYKIPPKVKALIPLPPQPKYGYLYKWLLRN